jgi:hypothetical protein
MIRPALIARPAEPGVELVLHSALDDQSRTELRELRQRLARVLADPHGKQLVDLRLDLRRRRYGTSHGVGPPSIVLSGLEGTYAVVLTAPRLFTAALGRDPDAYETPAQDEQRATTRPLPGRSLRSREQQLRSGVAVCGRVPKM